MSKGKLRCYGSSLFLKVTRFLSNNSLTLHLQHNFGGVGYNLDVTITPECDVSQLTQLVRGEVADAGDSLPVGDNVRFSLPLDKMNHFESLFAKLGARFQRR